MNVEIGTESPKFLFWEYLFRNFGILSLQCSCVQGVTQRCRLSLLTNSALVIESKSKGREGVGCCGVSANEYSCARHVTWSTNKLWRSTSIFNLWLCRMLAATDITVDSEMRASQSGLVFL